MKRRNFIAAASATLAAPAVWSADPSWPELVKQSLDYAGAMGKELEAAHRFSSIPNWSLDANKGELVFTSPNAKPLVAKIQIAGGVTQSIWRWSWADPTLKPQLFKDMETVRAYGAQRGFARLVEPMWQCEERDAWQVTAVANFLLKGKGVYRPPLANSMLFVVFTSLQRAA